MEGLSEQVVRELSSMKREPDWMLEARLEGWRAFVDKHPRPDGGDGSPEISFDDIEYRTPAEGDIVGLTDLGAPPMAHEADEVVRRHRRTLERHGVVFTDMDTAVREHPAIVRSFFGTTVGSDGNRFSALNAAVWSGGTFVYVPPGVEVPVPLQADLRPRPKTPGPFERSLIIADEGSRVYCIDGCSAPVYTSNPLCSTVVEVIVGPSADVTHTTLQNWSSNVVNLVTRRAIVEAEGHMRWVEGNIGSRLTVSSSTVRLAGPRAAGEALSVAYAGRGQHQQTGATMVHAAPGTTSGIVSKTICRVGGHTTDQAVVHAEDGADGCRSEVRRDALMLDAKSLSETHPTDTSGSGKIVVADRAAVVSTIHPDQLFYLMSRGLTEEQATAVILNGFIEPVTRTLPIEYAVEWSRWVELHMEGSVG